MYKVLLLDDDKIQHLIYQRLISYSGIPIEADYFFDGNEAFEFLLANKQNGERLPDFIFVDLHMPVMNGWQFLDRVKGIYDELDKPVRVNVVTSSFDHRDMMRAKNYHFIESFNTKPLKRDFFDMLPAYKV